MRKIVLAVNMTLDGCLAGPAGELDWMTPDPAMNVEFTADLRAEVDTMIAGREAYHALHQAFSLQATHPDSPPELVDFATWMVQLPKVVFSRSGTELHSPADRLATAGVEDEVAALREGEGKGLVLFGGVDIAQQFVRLGVVDEFWIKLYPVVLGPGRPLFTDLKDRTDLVLTGSRAYPSGIVTLRYGKA